MNSHCQQQIYLRPSFIPIFNFPHKRPTFAFTGKSGYTTRLRSKNRTQRLTRRNRGHFGWGWYHYPRSVPHIRKPPRAGYQNGVLCRFWVLVGCTPEEHRGPAGQRCAHARRCSEASRPRWAAHTYAVNTSIFPAEFFSQSQKTGKKSHSLMFHIHVFDRTA